MATILLVDDEELFLKTTTRYFLRKGFEVIAHGCAQDALDLFSKDSKVAIDVVILDYDLPDMRGTECLRTLLLENENLRSIILSGYPPESFNPDDVRDADEILYKPIELNLIEEVVVRLLAG